MPSALPCTLIDKEEKRRQYVAVCPEEWGDSFGNEFYDFSLDNCLYYAPVNDNWRIQQKCKAIEGQLSFNLMSNEELLDTAEYIKENIGGNR